MKVICFVNFTIIFWKCVYIRNWSICNSHHVLPSHEQGAHSTGLGECKEEGVATGLVPILGHHHELQTLRLCKGAEDQALQRVATEGNSLLGNETYQCSGSSCCAVAEVTERVVAEEKIHQRVHPEPNQKKKNVTSISENVPTPITDWCPVCLISFYAFEVYSSQTM